ncbi:hypothetical protein [Caulobacter sp.]|uniref:hypothetical protein n=1 Tax=Caulobacter sp. TaxID=78 RepID=UPI003BABE398
MRTLNTIGVAAITGALLLATGAQAQSASTPWSPPAAYRTPSTPFNDSSILTQMWRQSLTDTARIKATRPEWIRARRAAALVNANRCAEAYALARAERDARLASGVKKICTAPAT